jgi:hypothetical protein
MTRKRGEPRKTRKDAKGEGGSGHPGRRGQGAGGKAERGKLKAEIEGAQGPRRPGTRNAGGLTGLALYTRGD